MSEPAPADGAHAGQGHDHESNWSARRSADDDPPSSDRPAPFRGWRIVGAGATIQGIQSGLLNNAFGSYSVLMRAEFGWSSTMMSAAFAMTRAESGLLGPYQGKAIDRFGPRLVMQIGVLIMGLSFLAFSQIRNPVQFFVIFLLVAVGASLSGFLTVTTTVVCWFERHRAKALSFAAVGFAAGGLVVPAVVWFMERFGWRAASFWSGLFVLVAVFPLSFVFVHRPSDVGEYVDGRPPEAPTEPEEKGRSRVGSTPVSAVHFTAREALRTPAFWLISFGHASALLVVGAVMLHLAGYLVEQRGLTLQEAGFVGGALPLLQLVGQIGGGILGDKVEKRWIAMVAMLGHMAGLLLLAHASSRWMIWAFVPIHGLSWGARGPLMQAIRADYFGSTSFGAIMGYSSLIVMLGTIAGPLVAGVLYDRSGSYTTGFTILAIMAGLGLTFFALARPPEPPSRPERDTVSALH